MAQLVKCLSYLKTWVQIPNMFKLAVSVIPVLGCKDIHRSLWPAILDKVMNFGCSERPYAKVESIWRRHLSYNNFLNSETFYPAKKLLK